MAEALPFGPAAWLVISLYIGSLLVFGWYGKRASRENTLHDFYLAGSSLGLVVMVLTLYATQYSGNSMFGFSGKAYRIGFDWTMSVQFMAAIIMFYLIYGISLHRLAHKHGFLTPVDYLSYRFDSKWFNIIATIVMIFALSNYLLAQLMAMGRALQGLTGGETGNIYNYGVVILALVMVIYGSLGGMRAIAWSDVVQGFVLMFGFILLLFMLVDKFGPLSVATQSLVANPDLIDYVDVPNAARLREWLSYILLIGMGGALYPQAIQRLYAAKNERILRQSFAVMVFLPYFTVLISLIAGIYALAHLPGLSGAQSDQVLSRLLFIIQQDSVFGYWLVVIIFAAVISAIMSTADSALLCISSMFTKDIYASFIKPGASQAHLTLVGKLCSWLVIIMLTGLAILLQDKASLVKLIDRKFDMLVQLVPAFMLGIHWRGLQKVPLLVGAIVGLLIAGLLAFYPFSFTQSGKLWGIHPGLYGLVINMAIVVLGSLWLNASKPE